MNFEAEYSSNFLYEIVCDQNSYLMGDVNNDGILNVLDIIILVNIVLGLEIESSSSDVNEDGVVNILDIINTVNIILND